MLDDLTCAAFDAPDLLAVLDRAPMSSMDALQFGLIVMDRGGEVIWYNAYESERAGLSQERVVGRNFFASVGP